MINFFSSTNDSAKMFLSQKEYDSVVRRSMAILDRTHRSRQVKTPQAACFKRLHRSLIIGEECDALNALLTFC